MLETVMKFFQGDLVQWVGAVVLVINSIIALSLMIPGEQPEKFLQKVVDFLAKFSKK